MPPRTPKTGRSRAILLGSALGALALAAAWIAWSLTSADADGSVDSGVVGTHTEEQRVPEVSAAPESEALERTGVRTPETHLGAALKPDRIVHGRVIDSITHAGLEGASITLSAGGFECSATSAPGGEFELGWVNGVATALEVRLAGYVARRKPSVEWSGNEEIELVRSGSFEGRIADAHGLAASEGKVEVWRNGGYAWAPSSSDSVLATVPLDSSGQFTIPDLAPGGYDIGVTSPLTPRVIECGVRIRPGEVTLLNLVLASKTSLVGQVVLRTSKAPVEGALVTVRDSTTLTDAAGKYTISGVDVGPQWVRVTPPWGGLTSLNANVAAGDLPSEQNFRIPAPASLSGVVQDDTGAPLSGVSVVVVPDDVVLDVRTVGTEELPDPQIGGRVQSKASGAFHFESLTGAKRLLLAALPLDSSQSPAFNRSVFLKEGEARTGLVLTLADGGSVRGRVITKDGEAPIALAEVVVETKVGKRWGRWSTTQTNANGEFVFTGLPGRAARVFASHSNFFAGKARVTRVGLDEDHVIKLNSAYALTGFAVNESGDGVSNVRIIAKQRRGRDRTVWTDEFGRFRFDGLHPERLTLVGVGRAWRSGPAQRVQFPDESHAVLTLHAVEAKPTCVVTGEIVLRSTSAPPKGLVIHGAWGSSSRIDGTRFRISGLKPGPLELRAEAKGKETIYIEGIELAPGANIDVGRFEMRSTARVTVHVTDATGKPLDGAKVHLEPQPPKGGGWARQGRLRLKRKALGEYRHAAVARYVWRITVVREGFQKLTQILKVRSGRVETTVRLKRRGAEKPSATPPR